MPSALSADLRKRVIIAIEAGASRREASRSPPIPEHRAMRDYITMA